MEADSDAYIKRLYGSFVRLRESGKLCDTVLVTSDRQLLAHSIVLAAASPVFCAAFQSCTSDGSMNYRLQVEGLDGHLMEMILNCIYSGCGIPVKTSVDAEAVVGICDQLGIRWMVDSRDANNPEDHGLQMNNTETCKIVTGCYQQPEVERCPSPQPQPSESITNSNDILHETCISTTPIANDSSTAKTASSSLCSAAETEELSIAKILCSYVCDVCNQQFSSGAALQSHRRRHKHCATCSKCAHSFYSNAVLHHHLLMQCPRKMTTCNICQQSFDGWPNLLRHTTIAHPASFLCQLCGQAFHSLHQLLAHRSLHVRNVYQCQTCLVSFDSQKQLRRHVRKHTADGEDGPVSDSCVREISGNECIYENNMSWDNVDVSVSESWLKEINADACLLEYSLNDVIKDTPESYQQKEAAGTAIVSELWVKENNASQLPAAHSLAHRLLPVPAAVPPSNGHVDHRCIILQFDKQPVAMVNPLAEDATVKVGGQQRVTCAQCSRTFKRLSDLHVHMRCHTGEMKFKCSVCGRPFRKSGTLSRHMRIHTGERPYICETCGKSYKLLFHLQLHMTAHSSDRPFSCDLCGKAFQSASSLKKHRFVHTGVKPFSCPVCMRLFNRRSNMQAHLRVHDSARQHDVFGQEHICILCRKKFDNSGSLQAHLQTHAHQLQLHVAEADELGDGSSKEMTYCKMDKQQTEDVYVALPLDQFDFDVS